jgi:hypothetical protein
VDEIAAKEARGKPIEIWFQDEARVGQKNKIARRWAKRGTRPSAPHDQRTSSAYIFGAICPAEGKGAGLVLPSCNTEAMALHLAEISRAVAPGAHALVFLDQAGWHVSIKLPVPGNITLAPLPPKSPELNPVENIWQFMRGNCLCNDRCPACNVEIEPDAHEAIQGGKSAIIRTLNDRLRKSLTGGRVVMTAAVRVLPHDFPRQVGLESGHRDRRV